MIAAAAFLAGALLASALPSVGDQPVELGRVRWGRDHADAFARARDVDRPVLLLFQEIPG